MNAPTKLLLIHLLVLMNEQDKERRRGYARRFYIANRVRVCAEQRIRSKRAYEKNKTKILARMKQFALDHPERRKSIRKASAEWNKLHPERARCFRIKSYQKHREKRLAKSAEWSKDNPDKASEYSKRHYRKLRTSKGGVDNIRAYHRRYSAERRKRDTDYRMIANLRNRIWVSMNRSKREESSKGLLGCTIPELKKHLESLFQPGMSWRNYGRSGWHIDHRIPCSAFDLTDPLQIAACFNFKNLQPLWASDNMRKNNRIGEQYGNALGI